MSFITQENKKQIYNPLHQNSIQYFLLKENNLHLEYISTRCASRDIAVPVLYPEEM